MYIVYIYIYIYINNYSVLKPEELSLLFNLRLSKDGRDKHGVSTSGVTANVICFLTEGLFGTPVKGVFQQMPGHTGFSIRQKSLLLFAAAPLALTPSVRNQGSPDAGDHNNTYCYYYYYYFYYYYYY